MLARNPIPCKNAPLEIQALLNIENKIPDNVVFIPYKKNVTSKKIFMIIGACIIIPVIISIFFSIFKDSILSKIFGYLLLGILVFLVIFIIKEFEKSSKTNSTDRKTTNGFYITNNKLIHKVDHQCFIISKEMVSYIKYGWIMDYEGTDKKGIKIYLNNEEILELSDEFHESLNLEDLNFHLNQWVNGMPSNFNNLMKH